jgi:hypothetical protein
MNRFKVEWWRFARQNLAQLWIDGPDRVAITHAADEIDRLLTADPESQIVERHEGLCRMTFEPLSVQFSIDESKRNVTVWTVRRTGA